MVDTASDTNMDDSLLKEIFHQNCIYLIINIVKTMVTFYFDGPL